MLHIFHHIKFSHLCKTAEVDILHDSGLFLGKTSSKEDIYQSLNFSNEHDILLVNYIIFQNGTRIKPPKKNPEFCCFLVAEVIYISRHLGDEARGTDLLESFIDDILEMRLGGLICRSLSLMISWR